MSLILLMTNISELLRRITWRLIDHIGTLMSDFENMWQKIECISERNSELAADL